MRAVLSDIQVGSKKRELTVLSERAVRSLDGSGYRSIWNVRPRCRNRRRHVRRRSNMVGVVFVTSEPWRRSRPGKERHVCALEFIGNNGTSYMTQRPKACCLSFILFNHFLHWICFKILFTE